MRNLVLAAKSHTHVDKVNILLFYQTYNDDSLPFLLRECILFMIIIFILKLWFIEYITCAKSGTIVQRTVTYLGILWLSLDPCLEGVPKKSNTVHCNFCAEGLM